MFTTKLTGLEVHSTHTESPCMRILMDVYIRKSKISMAVRQCLGISPPNESTFEKLSELRESIGISHVQPAPKRLVSGTLRRPRTTDYPSIPKSFPNWMNADAKSIISWMKIVGEELRHDQQLFLEHFMTTFNCTRNEAKARTFGVRYGSPAQTLHSWRKDIFGDVVLSIPDYDLSSLERRISGIKATSYIIDDVLGPKDLSL